MLLKNLHIILLFLFAHSLVANESVDENDINQQLLAISNDLYYDYSNTMDRIDSISKALTAEDQILLKPYFDYFESFRAYKNSEYEKSLTYADSALTYFLWHENVEWEARSLLVLAFTAEALILDNHSINYYETSAKLTNNNIVKGVALLGLARSKRRLKEPYEDEVNIAIKLFEETHKEELHLLAVRSYYSFYTRDSNLVKDLTEVEEAYQNLNNNLYAATANKQISYYYKDIKDYEKAIFHAEKAMSLIENSRDSISVFMGSMYLYYSYLLIFQDKQDETQRYIEASIDINSTLGLDQSNFYAYQRLSRINRFNEDYKAADDNSQRAIYCQRKMNESKGSSNALLAEVSLNREYIDHELRKGKTYHYIRLGLLVVISLVVFRTIISRFRRQVKAKDVEVNKLQEDNTVLAKNTIELLSIVKKLEKESDLISASEDFERRIMNDVELSSTLPQNFCMAYQKNISTFSFKHPKLTQAEVRTAVMLAMEIPAKSIVKLQCVEPNTIKTYRKRIRRKLELQQGVDLNLKLQELLYDLSHAG